MRFAMLRLLFYVAADVLKREQNPVTLTLPTFWSCTRGQQLQLPSK